jgi:hypothetical protein
MQLLRFPFVLSQPNLMYLSLTEQTKAHFGLSQVVLIDTEI